jgi:hypothetical protein
MQKQFANLRETLASLLAIRESGSLQHQLSDMPFVAPSRFTPISVFAKRAGLTDHNLHNVACQDHDISVGWRR